MKRFLVSEKISVGARIRLSPEESKHATRVMRLEVGAKVLLTDGQGREAEAELLETGKAGAMVAVVAVREAQQKPFRVELLQATLKGSRMDWLVEKSTELGVSALHVVDTQFSVAGERAERWTRVAQAALKQSGNLSIPEIHESRPLSEALSLLPKGFFGFLLSPGRPEGLAEAIQKRLPNGQGIVVLAVGPEGGFSESEEKLLEESGFLPCCLSSQILRGETAALTAAAVALHALEFKLAHRL